jgi:predicted XRE-type DNA-binding protein
LALSPKDQKWLDDHEDQLPRMDRGGKVGGSKISYFEELIPERIGGMSVDPAPVLSDAPYQAAESLLIHAVRMARLSAIEVYVLSRRAAGLKQREIAEETGIARPHIARMMSAIIRKLRQSPRTNKRKPKR